MPTFLWTSLFCAMLVLPPWLLMALFLLRRRESRARQIIEGLTDLIEVARFSDRPVCASMKGRAIDCLLEVRHAVAAEVR